MENQVATSLFFFRFFLRPWEACLNFNFAGVSLPQGFSAVCTRDQLGLLVGTDPGNFDPLKEWAVQLASALANAHGYFAPQRPALQAEWDGWLEVQRCPPTTIIAGYAHPSLQITTLDSRHPDNEPFRQAAALLVRLDAPEALLVALNDFQAARRDVSPYSVFYAYRVLEDIAYGFGVTKDDKPEWKAMNAAFGTPEDGSHWRVLTKAGTAARHLNPDSLKELQAIGRTTPLALAKEALDRWIAYLTSRKT